MPPRPSQAHDSSACSGFQRWAVDDVSYHHRMVAADGELTDFWAVVPAGGAGTRLWPLSRSERPKFLLDLAGTGRSLLQAAWDRLNPLCGERFLLVTGAAHAESVREQLPALPTNNVLLEPAPRDSMAAIGLAAATLEQRDPTLVLGSFPADHVIPEVSELHECIRQGYAAARTGLLALIGIKPTRPTSALGYIQLGRSLELPAAPLARTVEAFIEKPSRERALGLVQARTFFWNAGMWIAQAGTLMKLLADANHQLASDLRAIARDPECMPSVWEAIERTTIDHTLAEPLAGSSKICVVPGDFEWEDIGDFGALKAYLSRRSPGVQFHSVVSKGRALGFEATGVTIGSSNRTIAVVGLDRVVVVDTEDALLVMGEDYAQRLKEVYNLVSEVDPDVR